MNALADAYVRRDVGFIFLYTNEAHPGENYPHLTSMMEKFNHARAMQDVYGVARPILLDALDGACHRAFGGMPNMTWIFNRAAVPVYKADWTDVNSVGNALEYFLDVAERRRNQEKLSPFRVERLDYRESDRERFYKGLALNGPKAVREFDESGL
ncbi:MAG: hypothetical protein H6654_11670 [Ardenticatenaceae bacterium]|nr:hypothetical protein [Anaerolineales bacterium]MCB8937638.1 hypothetical protein [Ardenticatenaceae bacterium]MCB8974207.1 hypothetical protein [Ardenticatenaceae bacterium]